MTREDPTFRTHYAQHGHLREAEQNIEIWTSGSIASDALAKLKEEQFRRVKAKVDWKDGDAVLALVRAGKEKALADALNQHFFRHPFAEVAKQLEAGDVEGKTSPWMPPPKSDLPALQGQSIEVMTLDGRWTPLSDLALQYPNCRYPHEFRWKPPIAAQSWASE